jgi:hypothetical protein
MASKAFCCELLGPVVGWREVTDGDVVRPIDEGKVGDLVCPFGVGDVQLRLEVPLGEQVVPLYPLLQRD